MKNKILSCIFVMFVPLLIFSCGPNKNNTPTKTIDQDQVIDVNTEPEVTKDIPEEVVETPRESLAYNLADRTDHPPLDNKEAFIAWRLERINEKEKLVAWRWDRAEQAILRKDISHPRVLEAFLRTPREVFARKSNESRAYEDAALGLSYGQTISGPHMVCRTTNELNPDPDMKVLEIGTGSGYQSAVFAQLSNYVYTIEIIEPLAKDSARIQESMVNDFPEYKNIKRKIADGYYGWEEYAPFDRIAVTCGIDHIPPPLLEQLAPDGIMLIPVGPPDGQTMLRVTKTINPEGTVSINREDVYKGTYYPIFVPFTNEKGIRHSVEQDMPGQ
ncbi:MAG: protein-L-isoaspartate O-methyltransferase [Spirochaetales bacterium]|nr:protein-L-isoaspartate O-methyltransferase [Spirochaetales bacterium]